VLVPTVTWPKISGYCADLATRRQAFSQTAPIQTTQIYLMNSLQDLVYPPPLKTAEDRKVGARHGACSKCWSAPRVGVALSGGGIRSATFCLGLFQALAGQNLLKHVDFLSTVSGGGYFGSFLGALYQRKDSLPTQSVEKTLADPQSWPVRWLRENGRYLSPNGAGGLWVFVGTMLRNCTAIHVVLLTFLLMQFTLANLAWGQIWASTNFRFVYERYMAQHELFGIQLSPSLLLPMLPFLAVMLPTGFVYWFVGSDKSRNRLTHGFTIGLMAAVALAVFAVVDSAGQTLYAKWVALGFGVPKTWIGFSAVGAVILAGAKKLAGLLEKMPSHRAVKIPVNLIISLVALVWVAFIAVSLSFVAHLLAWQGLPPWSHGAEPHRMTLGLVALDLFALSLFFGWDLSFINLSSLQQIYAARLKRAYIGASNPDRMNNKDQKGFDITNPQDDDDIAFKEYHPDEHGGPLHIINVTVNETVSGKSQIDQQDRKGLSMAIGPCGISVGDKDHALWTKDKKVEIGSSITTLPKTNVNDFNTLRGKEELQPANDGEVAKFSPHKVEALNLGQWVSISGAAVATGMGANTNVGLSLLLGLANVRLGYWWNSGVNPRDREARTKPSPSAWVGATFARLFTAQSYLIDEFLARFHGPARRDWYLSDGGHFENTAAYELIRRRLDFIIVSDAGRDATSTFVDVANLVRKARIDFNAEIEFLRRESATDPAQTRPQYPVPPLNKVVHPELLLVIGEPEDFVPVPGARDPDAKEPAKPFGSAHALLARVHYLDTDKFSWMLFLKPGLTGDEPEDVLEYQTSQPDFPQESTADQFFNEAQWESYRKLGEHIGNLVFAQPKAKEEPKPATQGAVPSLDWTPHSMNAPETT